MVYGSLDPSYKYVPFVEKHANVRILEGEDHNLKKLDPILSGLILQWKRGYQAEMSGDRIFYFLSEEKTLFLAFFYKKSGRFSNMHKDRFLQNVIY